MPGISLRRAAKCFGDSANQYTMINFHLPPIAASAAVSVHPPTGLGRERRALLPESAFLMELIGQIIFLLDQVSGQIIQPYTLERVLKVPVGLGSIAG